MIEFFIPLLPERALSPNGRAHYMAVARARKELRQATWIWARQARAAWHDPIDPARVTLTLQQTRKKPRDGYYRPHDRDNAMAALKPVFDGIKDAGLIVDDTAEHIEPVVEIEWVEELADEGIAVKVEPAGETGRGKRLRPRLCVRYGSAPVS